jgi:hypothetical protein
MISFLKDDHDESDDRSHADTLFLRETEGLAAGLKLHVESIS